MVSRAGWTMTFEGSSWRESDLTLEDTIRALEVCGGDWTELHPLTSPSHFVALLGVFLSHDGEDFDAAVARASRVRTVDALAMVTIGEDAADTTTREADHGAD